MYEKSTHSFVVKVWLEQDPKRAGQVLWRGHVIHVMSKQQRYVERLDDISDFVADYLRQSGINLSLSRRLRQWMRKAKR